MGSMNYGQYSRRRKDLLVKALFDDPFDTVMQVIQAMGHLDIRPGRRTCVFKTVMEKSFGTTIGSTQATRGVDTRPDHESSAPGHLATPRRRSARGLLGEPLQISCVMGVTGGIRPTPRNLAHM